MFIYSNFNIVFLVLHLFSYFLVVFFLLLLSTFKPLNALYSTFERSKISEGLFCVTEIEGARLGNPPQLGLQNFELLKR